MADDADWTVRDERLARVLAAADLGVWELEPVSGAFLCSAAARAHLGLPSAGPIDYATFRAACTEVEGRERVDALLKHGTHGSSFSIRCRVAWPDGTVRAVDLRGSSEVDPSGRALLLTGVTSLVGDEGRAEERLQLLDAVGQATRSASRAEDVMAITCRLLGQHLSATRVAYADVDADNDRFRIRHDWTLADAGSTVGEYSLALFGSLAVHELGQGRPLVVRDVDRELGPDGGGAMFNAIGIQAIVCCSLVKEGRLLAMMAVHQATPRAWTDDDVTIVQEVVERCWAHIERIRAADDLIMQDRLKDEFLATLAHELRTPLASISLGTNLLGRSTTAAGDAERVSRVVQRQMGHLVRLVDDLLDIARIRRGQLTLQLARIALQDAIQDGLESSRPFVEAAEHHLEVDLPSEPLYVEGDSTRLAQIVANLINNAAKYTPNGGRITVRLEARGAEAKLQIRDDGVGIDAAMLPKIFELFEQGRGTLHRSQGGLGLGLALVRKLASLHGGSVTAHSAGNGHGSTFVVSLPLLASSVEAEPDLGPATSPPRPLRVLVVEDNEDAAEVLKMALELNGHEVEIARDGASGLASALRFVPDIVLLDLGLPDRSGLDVARALRADPRTNAIRLVALTGWGSSHDRDLTREAGFDAHLTKPADLDVLEKTLAELCPATEGRLRTR